MIAATVVMALCALVLSSLALAEQEEFLRVQLDEQGKASALQVAVARYRNGDGITVDLVSAVHVADREYFQAIENRLSDYHRVLYEMVADPEGAPAPVAPSMSVIGLMQGGMKNALGLAFQLDEIDYASPTFVHADLTPREFSSIMQQRDESLVGLLVRAWALGLADPGATASADAELFKVLFASNRQLALRRMLARQLVDQSSLFETISGDDGTTLIEGRNARALEVMARELEAGHTHLAIFYGAGHMPDFARRLKNDFGFRHVATEWLTAWDLR